MKKCGVLVIALIALAGCGKNEVSAKVPDLDRYEENEYVVGKDIPAGKYQLVADKDAEKPSYSVFPDEKKDKEKILAKGAFGKTTYLSLKKDTFVDVSNCHLVPLNKAEIETVADYETLESGHTYEVGKQISEGTYKVTTNDGMTFFSIYDSMAGSKNSDSKAHGLIDTEIIELTDGQFLQLDDNTAVLLNEDETAIIKKVSQLSENPTFSSRYVESETASPYEDIIVTLDNIDIENLDEYKHLSPIQKNLYVLGYLSRRLDEVYDDYNQFLSNNLIVRDKKLYYPLGKYADTLIEENPDTGIQEIMTELSNNFIKGFSSSFTQYGFDTPKNNFFNNY